MLDVVSEINSPIVFVYLIFVAVAFISDTHIKDIQDHIKFQQNLITTTAVEDLILNHINRVINYLVAH